MTEMIYRGPSPYSPALSEVEFWEVIDTFRYSCLTDLFTIELGDLELLAQHRLYYHELFTGPEGDFYKDPQEV